MKFSVLVASALLPLGIMANPGPVEADDVVEARTIERPQHCAIIGGSSTVNCRSGWTTSARVKRTLTRGNAYDFWCVKTGECVTINGAKNCGWHYLRDLDCFVNGHYTDNHCTLARLGGCGNFDLDGEYNSDPFKA
ncbi:uncharacterized protein EI97DRAFT_446470 [Westerdykella ornata]|uniref:Cyanovirin-N domain-containing protein n=1 Tax=Westerdykella ornata TaxID=318751 RepID=A0A6A6J4X8_WESOR|nr:uncharacterized protein EI97DRAFT_446470 [Westerdykella ornata]KAF2271640.1 hypothetical protein EI97DRAFT_446470 [Westerdykella ornata]